MKTPHRPNGSGIVLYQSKNGAFEIKTDTRKETVWLTQQQVAELFDVQKAAISKHVKNIFDSGELGPKATVSKMETVQKEGERKVKRVIEHYNLDLVLSVGYRVNSVQATHFRQWATKTLRDYIAKGYAFNRNRIARNYGFFLQAVEDVKKLLPAETVLDSASVLDLVKLFADTWFSLDAFDKGAFAAKGITRKQVALTAEKLSADLEILKTSLCAQGQATDLFGKERVLGGLSGIVGNVMQSFDGKELYPTVEDKAAHLLYFIVKNHPFVDGNKRSGAYAFVWFLRCAGVLDVTRMTPSALTALTLLIAESDPKHKEKMIKLILTMLLRGLSKMTER